MENNQTSSKTAQVLQSESIRDIVSTINSLRIPREDVISVMQDARTHEFVLLYYI